MSGAIIETRALCKSYGSFQAVKDLNLTVARGEVFGMLGPNGAGKTTTILMLLGLTEVTSGSVRIVGCDPTQDPLEVKRRVAYMPDSVGFYDQLSARTNLRYSARLAGIPRDEIDARIDAALERIQLLQVADKAVGTYSRGMRQRLGLAEVLMKQPDVAILDEPTSGLDPEVTLHLLEIIRDLKRDGMTILLSSHLLQQVQDICDRVGLFYKGQLALEGRVQDLAQTVLGSVYRVSVEAEGGNVEATLQRLPGVSEVVRVSATGFALKSATDIRSQIADAVARAGGRLLGFSLIQPSLDEVYTTYFRETAHAA